MPYVVPTSANAPMGRNCHETVSRTGSCAVPAPNRTFQFRAARLKAAPFLNGLSALIF